MEKPEKVKKRQRRKIVGESHAFLKRIVELERIAKADMSIPVSYTHLDVYKRQGLSQAPGVRRPPERLD